MAIKVPETLRAALEPDVVKALDEALGPPAGSRASGSYELEVEAKGEGTFTLRYQEGVITASKGFADEPLLAAQLNEGGFPLIARVLEAAAAGFPESAELNRRQQDLRGLPKADWDKVAKATERLKEMVVVIELRGGGTYRVARGSLEEATRELRIEADTALVDRLLAGGVASELGQVKVSGERGLLTELAAAFGPLLSALKR
jgi:hypothetical protein